MIGNEMGNMCTSSYDEYPVPFMSDNIAEFISDRLGEFDIVVEYGSGSSTRYFLRKLRETKRDCEFVSVEHSRAWFLDVIEGIMDDLRDVPVSERVFNLHPWGIQRIISYLKAESRSKLAIPPNLQRLPKSQQALGGFLHLLKLLLHKSNRPHDGLFSILVDNSVRFLYLLRAELMKDQFGESPFKMRYINAGLDPVRKLMCGNPELSAAFIIDGGPRGDIMDAIFDLEDLSLGLRLSIFLPEAHRTFYWDTLGRRETGIFIKGSNRMLNGDATYDIPCNREKNKFFYGKPDVTEEELSAKELWYYRG